VYKINVSSFKPFIDDQWKKAFVFEQREKNIVFVLQGRQDTEYSSCSRPGTTYHLKRDRRRGQQKAAQQRSFTMGGDFMSTRTSSPCGIRLIFRVKLCTNFLPWFQWALSELTRSELARPTASNDLPRIPLLLFPKSWIDHVKSLRDRKNPEIVLPNITYVSVYYDFYLFFWEILLWKGSPASMPRAMLGICKNK
jgi:hypothetical protein